MEILLNEHAVMDVCRVAGLVFVIYVGACIERWEPEKTRRNLPLTRKDRMR